MKKTILLSLICCVFTAMCYSNTFVAVTTGNWNSGIAVWIDLEGGDPDGIPDADDDVIIGDNVTVTCTSSVACIAISFDFTINGSGNEARLTIAAGGTVTVSGTVTINDEDGIPASEIANIFLSDASAVLDMNGGLVFSATSVGKARITYSRGATVRLAGNITNTNGQIVVGALGVTGTFMYDGAAAQTLVIDGNNLTYPSITINNSAASPTSVSLNGNITTTNLRRNLTIQDGILLTGANTITGNAFTFTIEAGAALNISDAASGFPTGFATYTMNAASTVEYSAAGAQTIAAQNYGNLTSSNTGVRTLASSGTIGIAGTFTAGTNSYTVTGSTVNFNGAAVQTISTGFTFDNLSIDNALGVSLGANVDLTGTLTLTNGILTTTGRILTLISNGSGTARVGNIPGTGDITGNITMQRLIPAVPDWRILTPSVAGTTIADWNGEIYISCIGGAPHTTPHFTSVYTYNETVGGIKDNGYSADDDPGPAGLSLTDALTTGTGYFMWVGTCKPPCSPTTITTDLTGTLVKGTQTVSCSYTASGGDTEDGWNLIGNPFPSDFSWDATTSTGGVTGIAYVYDPATNGYLELNRALPSDRDVIPSQQGFWAKASGSSGTVVIEEIDKAADGNNFLKVGNNPPGFTLTLDGNGFTDITEFYFLSGANDVYDAQIDAIKLNSLNDTVANFSSVTTDSIDLAQNFLPEFTQNFSIPIRITWNLPGNTNNYTISANDLSGLPLSTCIVLEDLATGIFTNLRTDTSYTFTMIADTALPPRFLLHTGTPVTKEVTNVKCNGASDGIAIVTGQGGSGPWSYVWLNSNEDTIQTSLNINSADTLSGLPAGTYTVFVTNIGALCTQVSDIINITEPDILSANAAATDASCNGDSNGTAAVAAGGGSPPYTYLWNDPDATTADTATNLPAGNYSVTITDSNGCVQTANTTINEPVAVIADFSVSADTIYISQGGTVQLTNNSSNASSYEWDFGDGVKSYDQSPWHNYGSTGNYIIKLIAANADMCYDSVNYQITVLDYPVGVIEQVNTGSSVQFLQNQNGVFIEFNLKKITEVKISIYNLPGQKVTEDSIINVQNDRVKINFADESQGIYFVKVEADGQSITGKIIH